MKVFCDIEANGLLPILDTIHSLVVKTEQGDILSCSDREGYPLVRQGVEALRDATTVIGHNFIGFDAPALVKMGYVDITHKVIDTHNLSRLIIPDLLGHDMMHHRNIPKDQWGDHTLKAWGYRLGCYKGEFGETTDWSEWSKEMQDYCIQDVEVTEKLYYHLMSFKPDPRAIKIEMDFQIIMAEQEREGVPFDSVKAYGMKDKIQPRLDELVAQIREVVPENKKYTQFTPKRDNRTLGYTKGVTVTKVKSSPFNPNSRPQILAYLDKTYGWKPTAVTKKGNPQLKGDDIEGIANKYPEVYKIARFLEANKLASQLYGGDKAWLNYVINGRIHGRVITNGAITGRCTHSSPNLAQIPSINAFMGKECRELFYAPEGYKIVGADASGLELRMLAHYLFPYDKGAYAKVILDGDVHVHNQLAAGLDTRDDAKTFIYSFIFGCGPLKTGQQVHPLMSEFEQKIKGRQIQNSFSRQIIGFRELKQAVGYAYKTKGTLRGIDGRILKPRGEHSALNTLLQGGGAVVCKYWANKMWELIHSRGLYEHVKPALNVHDESQLVVRDDYTERVGKLMVEAIKATGIELNINIPLGGEYKIGNNWAETH